MSRRNSNRYHPKRDSHAKPAVVALLFVGYCGVLVSIAAASPNPDPFRSWSTNFANVSDMAGAKIFEWSGTSDARLSIDTANVNSGGKSIRDTGTVDDRHLLQAVFSAQGLTGSDTVDLADKTLSVEIFVPSGSPVGYLGLELASGNDNLIVRANIYPQRGRWFTYKVDLKMSIALGSWRYANWLHAPRVSTTEDALNLLKHVQVIKINAQNAVSQDVGKAYFLIDRLGWEPSGDLPAYDPASESLRRYADAQNLLLGSFVEINRSSDPEYLRILLRELGSVEENQDAARWPATEPPGDRFDGFVQQPSDVFVDSVSEKLGAAPMRYLVFTELPGWLPAKSYDQTKTILENYTRAKVSYYKGKTKIWFILNEPLRYDIGYVPYAGLGLKDRNQRPQNWYDNYMPFAATPSDVGMIEAAFRAARAADPGALLFLVDGGNEEMGHPRPDAFYDLSAKLVRDGTPIDGVGLQAHLVVGADGKVHATAGGDYALAFNATDGLTGIAKNVDRFQALGLKVVFAEVDVPIWTLDLDSTPAGQQRRAQRLQTQADVYRSLLHITLTHSNMPAFILFSWQDFWSWTIYDPWGWGKSYGDPGLFDSDYRPKPAYFALLDELKKGLK
jgi:endo-1,4-beta-xylanase